MLEREQLQPILYLMICAEELKKVTKILFVSALWFFSGYVQVTSEYKMRMVITRLLLNFSRIQCSVSFIMTCLSEGETGISAVGVDWNLCGCQKIPVSLSEGRISVKDVRERGSQKKRDELKGRWRKYIMGIFIIFTFHQILLV
jgi:hypothetical protein